jgi:hypothetical protein
MPYTEAQKIATKKYLRSLKSLSIRITGSNYERYSSAAEADNMSLRSFVISAIEEKIARDQKLLPTGFCFEASRNCRKYLGVFKILQNYRKHKRQNPITACLLFY